jgi:hypothetical protein
MFSNEIPPENTRHNSKSQQRKKKAKIEATMSADTAAASDGDATSPLQKRIADCQEAIKDQTEPNLLPFIQDKDDGLVLMGATMSLFGTQRRMATGVADQYDKSTG